MNKKNKRSIRKQAALLVAAALMAGLLPMGNATAGKATAASVSAAGGTARAGQSLNSPVTDGEGVVTWDCVWFGNYWQEDTNGDGKADRNDAKQPIKWRVLSVNGDDTFLLADKNLDCQGYNLSWAAPTWETCTLRSWLNGYGAGENQDGKDYSSDNFLDHAFTTAEKEAIRTTTVVTDNNNQFSGGNDTSDRVYVLSIGEASEPAYGFPSDFNTPAESRMAKNTSYAETQAVSANTDENYKGYASWWLRSPGGGMLGCASSVSYEGKVNWTGAPVNFGSNAIRPAVHLNLSSDSSWSYAGTVTSKGEEKEVAPSTPAPDVTPTANPGAVNPQTPASSAAPVITPSAITVGKVSGVKLKQKKNAVTVSWKQVSGVLGYQVCYSTSGKWKNKVEKMTSKTKVTVKKLKKKKTYYFRVRAYRMNGKKKVYGKWSRTEKIKIKK